jgi:hypothetical protein
MQMNGIQVKNTKKTLARALPGSAQSLG